MIRKFKKSDAEECSKLIRGCIEKNLELNKENKKYMIKSSQPREIINKLKDRELFVNEIDGRILGVGALGKNEIRTMFVKPSMQKKSLGKQMLNFLINRAKSKGLKKVWLKSSMEAEGFYKKQGFKKIKDDYEFDFHSIFMEKEI